MLHNQPVVLFLSPDDSYTSFNVHFLDCLTDERSMKVSEFWKGALEFLNFCNNNYCIIIVFYEFTGNIHHKMYIPDVAGEGHWNKVESTI